MNFREITPLGTTKEPSAISIGPRDHSRRTSIGCIEILELEIQVGDLQRQVDKLQTQEQGKQEQVEEQEQVEDLQIQV